MAGKPHSIFPIVSEFKVKDLDDPDDCGIKVVIRCKGPDRYEICRPTPRGFDRLVQADFHSEERATAYCWQRYNAERRID